MATCEADIPVESTPAPSATDFLYPLFEGTTVAIEFCDRVSQCTLSNV
jgi:hypothetical protein